MTDEIDVYQLTHDDNERYFFEGAPFDGVAVERDDKGAVVARSTFRKGVEEGPAMTWYPDGSPESESELRNGSPVGLVREWHQSGTLSREIHYDGQGFPLRSRTWDSAGNVIQEEDWTGAPRR